MKKIFIDMDGVVATWQSWATMKDLTKKGYFESLAPVIWMIEVALKLFLRDDCELYVLTKFLKESPYAQGEKSNWLDSYLPFIDEKHRLFVPYDMGKVEFIEKSLGIKELTPDMLLLDDYSENLMEWEQKGGTPMKVMNGLNGNKGIYTGARISEGDLSALTNFLKEERK